MNRQFLFLARRGDKLCGIYFDYAFTHEKLTECAQGGQLAGDGSLLLFVRVQGRKPLADGEMVDLFQVGFGDRGAFPLSDALIRLRRNQVINELSEIALVIPEGMRADVALVAQMIQELSE